MALAGLVAAGVTVLLGFWAYAPLIGWVVAALVFEALVWFALGPLDAAATEAHATREDPSPLTSDWLLTVANLASLAAVAFVIVESGNAQGAIRVFLGGLALFAVAVSWLLVQTLFTLRYAVLYYSGPNGGVQFNQQEPPQYSDFAYLSFTMGMTYQVSDTNLTSRAFRSVVLRHALLSYVFGSVILATTISLVSGLSTS